MSKKIVPVALIAALALAVGVWPASGPSGAAPGQTSQTLDEIYAQMARDVPGFAGLRIGPDGETVQVFFKGSSAEARDAVEQAVAAFFEAEGRSTPRKIEMLPAQYDFSQLKGWYDRLTVVLPVRGIVMTDIDEAKNRLFIGVETAEVQSQVEQRVAELGIPREVVDIEVMEPIQEDSSLQDRHRPLVGGLQSLPTSRIATLVATLRQAQGRL